MRGWDAADEPRTRAAAADLAALGVAATLGGDGAAALGCPPAGCLVKSPGIPPSARIVVAARAAGIPILDELEAGWRLDGRPLVAVTGTNGKSTVARLVAAALAAAGQRPALAGNTRFGPPLSGLPAEAGDLVVAECSSYQLEHCPALAPDAAALTNLTEDHGWHHPTPAAYAAAKRGLFLRDGRAVPLAAVGVGEPFGAALAVDLAAAGSSVRTVGAEGDLRPASVDVSWSGTEIAAVTPGGRVAVRVAALGAHMAHNVLLALALADLVGVSRDAAIAALADCPPVPGRFERVDGGGPVAVVVDFAHNAAGVAAAVATARTLAGGGSRVRVMLSAPHVYPDAQLEAMGRAAGAGATEVVVTTDRWSAAEPPEPPAALVRGAAAGLGRPPAAYAERRDGVAAALGAAREGDVVILLGRGERPRRLAATGTWVQETDRELARAALAA